MKLIYGLASLWLAAASAEAPGKKHWAYVKPARPELPAVKDQGWVKNDIDSFILARLEKEGLKPSPATDRPRLIRRVSLALIGLPPTLEEVDAFVNDKSSDAYEKVVDRLLVSPRFGERWARQWLDLARYADSNGFQADQLRESWAFRDWVINALNRDMPFDQFTIEQLAGDLLPNATVEQKIATGFHRTPTCNVEAGVHPEENRVNQIIDRVNTTGTVWLGTTIECAQCHNHKYDPFTQKDYYQLFSYFNNTPLEVKQKGKSVTWDFYGPKLDLPLTSERETHHRQLSDQVAALEKERDMLKGKRDERQAEWERRIQKALENPPEWQALDIAAFECVKSKGVTHEILEDKSLLLGGENPDKPTYLIRVKTKLKGITGFKIEALTHSSLGKNGPGRHRIKLRPNFVLNEFKVFTATEPKAILKKAKPVLLHSAAADFSQRNFDVSGAVDGDPKTAWAIAPQFGKPHWSTFLIDKPVGTDEEMVLIFTFDFKYGGSRSIGRLRISALTGDPAAIDFPESVARLLEKTKRSQKEQKQINNHYAKFNPRLKKIKSQLARLKKQIASVKPPSTLVMVEMDEPRPNNIFIRGNFLTKGAKVVAGTPVALHTPKSGREQNRLGLAKWLVDPQNPLIGRVTVNRWWAEMFGLGIVETLEDFGTQSGHPSHPELLDWLAVEFMENGWSMKHVLKLNAMSATFQQSSRVSSALLQQDPKNRLFARGPRFRMDAEMVRDNALAVSGLLSTKIGGPPIYPPQPNGIWRHVGRNGPKFVVAKNQNRFRRGVYVVWRRGAPYVSFVNFDAPDRATCVAKRPRTNTPLQALTLMNDETYVELAMALAGRILKEQHSASLYEQVVYGFRLCMSRAPSKKEVELLVQVYRRQLERFKSDPKAARDLVSGVTGWKAPPKIDQQELATWFFVTNILLNLDETITRG